MKGKSENLIWKILELQVKWFELMIQCMNILYFKLHWFWGNWQFGKEPLTVTEINNPRFLNLLVWNLFRWKKEFMNFDENEMVKKFLWESFDNEGMNFIRNILFISYAWCEEGGWYNVIPKIALTSYHIFYSWKINSIRWEIHYSNGFFTLSR